MNPYLTIGYGITALALLGYLYYSYRKSKQKKAIEAS